MIISVGNSIQVYSIGNTVENVENDFTFNHVPCIAQWRLKEHLGVVVKTVVQKPENNEFYSYLRHEVNWVTLAQPFSLSPRKQTKLANKTPATIPGIHQESRLT